MSGAPIPPRYVPTLTEVVDPASMLVSSRAAEQGMLAPAAAEAPLHQLEDQVLHRVMQRVDLVLERRLREAVSQLVQTHTQSLGHRLREEIELVVRESVSQAISQELSMSSAND